MNKLVLSYWNVRGRTEPIRMLLNYLKLDYDYKGYDLETYQQWFQQDKLTLNTPFPNLPYLIDGQQVITESDAVAQYICFKANREDLVGEQAQDRVQIAQIRGFVQEQIMQIGLLAYNKNYKEERETRFQWFSNNLNKMEKYLTDNKYLNNGKICYQDFFFYEFVFIFNKFFSDKQVFNLFPQVHQHFLRIQNLPEIQQYHQSDKYNPTFLLYGPTASWNSRADE